MYRAMGILVYDYIDGWTRTRSAVIIISYIRTKRSRFIRIYYVLFFKVRIQWTSANILPKIPNNQKELISLPNDFLAKT